MLNQENEKVMNNVMASAEKDRSGEELTGQEAAPFDCRRLNREEWRLWRAPAGIDARIDQMQKDILAANRRARGPT
jgi:hypothetical protein